MKTVKLSELFDIERGKSYFKEFIEDSNGINYITTSGQNQGIKCKVAKNDKYKVYPAGTITVALQGSTMSAFVQTEDFILQTHVAALIPKKEMILNEKLYYCMCIQANAFKFSFGRKANTTFPDLLIPAEIPNWVYTTKAPDIELYRDQIDKYLRDENGKLTVKPDKLYDLIKSGFFDKNEPFTDSSTPELNTDSWKKFNLTDLFDIVKGNSTTQSGPEKIYPYVSSTSTNNGISDYRESDKYHPKGVLTVSANGACMDTFYQPKDFISCSDVNILYPKSDKFNKYNAMFFIPVLELEKFRFGYGRKSNLGRIKQLTIKLPVTPEGEPDYDYMEDYMKTLPYSKYI